MDRAKDETAVPREEGLRGGQVARGARSKYEVARRQGEVRAVLYTKEHTNTCCHLLCMGFHRVAWFWLGAKQSCEYLAACATSNAQSTRCGGLSGHKLAPWVDGSLVRAPPQGNDERQRKRGPTCNKLYLTHTYTEGLAFKRGGRLSICLLATGILV